MSGAKTGISAVCGEVAPGFEPVKEEFERNFRERGELGAALCVYLRGDKVVDLWGGYRNLKERTPWERDTLVLVFSSTKGLAAMTLALAHSRGLLDYEERVSTYWPEFAQKGKKNITVRQLISHQAGLCAIDRLLTPRILADLDRLADILAQQKPAWEPGTRHGYHGITMGFYEGELLRRVDPLHRSLGNFFRAEIAQPLGLEIYIGLPPGFPWSRIARLEPYKITGVLKNYQVIPPAFKKEVIKPWSLSFRAFLNPVIFSPADFGRFPLSAVEMPAANGIATARDIARAYSAFATGGEELNLRRETLQALSGPAIPPSGGLHDKVLQVEANYSLGYMKPFHGFKFGVDETAFGAPGAGGSFGFADPTHQVGYAYVMNRMGYYFWDDPREKVLRETLYRCLEER